MRTKFHDMLTEIERRLANEAGLVDRAIDDAVRAFVQKDAALAGKVVDGDHALDHAEVELERLCLDTMALQQPMAVDLRFLAAALKINSDLERMGDLACNVAKQAWRLQQAPEPEFADRLAALGESVRKMCRAPSTRCCGATRSSRAPCGPPTPAWTSASASSSTCACG
jgi:phosphate uptake regulator